MQQALAKENQTLQPGDTVIIRTGWSKLMGKENARYGSQPPGIGIAAGQWLLTQNPIMIASDTCCVEVRPSEPGYSLPIHAMMVIQHGIYLLENLELEKLAASGRRIRVHHRASEDQGRDRLRRRPDRHPLSSDIYARTRCKIAESFSGA